MAPGLDAFDVLLEVVLSLVRVSKTIIKDQPFPLVTSSDDSGNILKTVEAKIGEECVHSFPTLSRLFPWKLLRKEYFQCHVTAAYI